MNRDFFATFEDRKRAFAERAGIKDDVRAELVLTTGRAFIIDRIVETTDTFVQIDARDVGEDTVPISFVTLYHQISFVQFIKPKPKGQAGFTH